MANSENITEAQVMGWKPLQEEKYKVFMATVSEDIHPFDTFTNGNLYFVNHSLWFIKTDGSIVVPEDFDIKDLQE